MQLFKNNSRLYLIFALLAGIPLWTALLPLYSAGAASCVVAGTGDSEHLLSMLGQAFQKKHPGDKIIVPGSVGSNGGIHALLAGKTCLARIARPLLDSEKKQGLVSATFASSPVVFAVNPAARQLTGISTKQIIALYEGKIKYWHELDRRLESLGRIYPLTREFGDATIRVVERVLPAFKKIDMDKIPTYYSTPKAVRAVLDHKRAIAFLSMPEAVRAGLHILKINDKLPNTKNIEDGTYPFAEPFSIAYLHKLPAGLPGKFVDFLFSEEAGQLIRANNILPVRASK